MATLPGCATGGRDRTFEVNQLVIETVKVVTLTGDRISLGSNQWREVEVDLSALEAEPGQPARLVRTKAQPAQAEEEAKPGEIGRSVLAVAIRAAGCWWKDPHGFVPADG